VENVVRPPHIPVPSSGPRYDDSGRRTSNRVVKVAQQQCTDDVDHKRRPGPLPHRCWKIASSTPPAARCLWRAIRVQGRCGSRTTHATRHLSVRFAGAISPGTGRFGTGVPGGLPSPASILSARQRRRPRPNQNAVDQAACAPDRTSCGTHPNTTDVYCRIPSLGRVLRTTRTR
jgi:hypothetical protein